jgi:8-oxo-dGTP diphosphatase
MNMKYPGVGFGVMIVSDGKMLLGKRHSDPKKADSLLHGEGTWTFPGGKLDFHEKLHEGARREVKEETDLEVRKLDVMSVTNDMAHDNHFVTIGFLCRDFTGHPKILEPDEITEWKWFPVGKPPENMFLPTRKMWKSYMKKEIYPEVD